MTKDVGLRIRVDRELRDQFLDVCRAAHIPAAQVLREYMRTYVASRAKSDRAESRSGKEPSR